MIDLIFKFGAETDAAAALTDWRIDVDGLTQWSPPAGCGVHKTTVVTKQAVVNNKDPLNPVETRPRETDPAYWLVVTVPEKQDMGFDEAVHMALVSDLMAIDGFQVSEPATGQAEFTAEGIAAMIAGAKERAKDEIVRFADSIGDMFKKGVPGLERDSRPEKRDAAIAVRDGTATVEQTAILAGEVSMTGETIEGLAEKIIANSSLQLAVAGKSAGLRRATTKQIDAAATENEMNAILQQAKTKAESELKALMGGA